MTRIGIIRDGGTDFTILKKFVSIIFEKHKQVNFLDDNFYDFGNTLTITNALNRYMADAPEENYALYSDCAKDFRNRIENILERAIDKFNIDNPNLTFTNQDILVLNGDAEKILGRKETYFVDWAYTIYSVLWLAIEEFYNKMANQGYVYSNLPLILPIILFPSSEILLASCMYDFNKENFRSFKAKPNLKMKVYETDDTSALTYERLQEILDTYMVSDSLESMYHDLPEARKFIQILAFAPH